MNSFKESFKANYKGMLLVLISSLLVAIGQVFWKMSLGQINLYFIYGFACYGIGAISIIVAFNFGSFTVLHPMMAFGYVFSIVFGSIIFHEAVTTNKIIGVLFIIGGVIFIGGGDK